MFEECLKKYIDCNFMCIAIDVSGGMQGEIMRNITGEYNSYNSFYTLWCWIRISTLKILLQAKLEDFLQLLHTVQNRTPLTEVQNPSNNNKQNILHHVLEIGRQDLALAVIQNCDVSLLCQQCDVTVAGIRGKKNVLHYITELRSLDLAKAVLNKVRHSL